MTGVAGAFLGVIAGNPERPPYPGSTERDSAAS